MRVFTFISFMYILSTSIAVSASMCRVSFVQHAEVVQSLCQLVSRVKIGSSVIVWSRKVFGPKREDPWYDELAAILVAIVWCPNNCHVMRGSNHNPQPSTRNINNLQHQRCPTPVRTKGTPPLQNHATTAAKDVTLQRL
jgi:hypothetical protein